MNEETNPIPSENIPPTASAPDNIEEIGSLIGPYKLLQMIGEGGMGTVYMAEQERPVQRRVALKIIKSGMDTKQVVARFEAERQALSMMDHTNIAHVLDVGTTDQGRPYFVMELIKGLPITRYCDDKNLTINERLRLFKSVCNALQHAHQKGIIHRDLKPSNILVAEDDGKAIPKIIDFGLAKALHQRLTDKTMFTQLGQVVGTLEYMSPEQSSMNQLEVDTRTDIYSLGVLLYELLTGTVPFDRRRLRSAALDQVVKILREEEPPKPSVRLSTVESSVKVASHRGVEPKRLGLLLRGDLDWIVMKAMEKDRDRRYETANGFGMDVARYLNGDPVTAVPPSTGYRMRKFVKRNRASVIAGSIIATILILGVIGTSLGMFWALNERDKARSAEAAEVHAKAEALNSAKIATEQTKLAKDEANNARNQEKHARRLQQMADQRAVRAEKAERVAALREYFSRIQLAQTEWNYGDPALAVRTLRTSDWQLRGWEHDYLFTLFNKNHRTLIGQLSISYCVSFSADSKQIASGGQSGTIKIWDIASGKEYLRLTGHQGSILSVVFSPAGKKLASTSRDRTIKIWDTDRKKEIHTLHGHSDDVLSVVFSRDGKRIVSGSLDKTIKVWDVENGAEIFTLQGHSARISSVAFSPGGKRIVSGSWDETVRIWDVENRKELLTLTGHEESVRSVKFSPDGNQVVSGDHDGIINTWDSKTGNRILTIRESTRGYVQSVDFSPDGKQIVSGGYHGTLKIWDAETGLEILALPGHSIVVNSVSFSPNGKHIASADHDGTVKIWDIESIKEGSNLIRHSSFVDGICFSPNGKRIAAGDHSGQIKIWDSESGKEIFTLQGHSDRVGSVVFSPDGKQIVSGSWDGTIKVWDAENGTEVFTFDGHSDGVSSLAFSHDGKRIFSGSWDQTIKIWKVENGMELFTLNGHTTQVSSLAISPDGKRLVSGDFGMEVKIWNIESKTDLLTMTGHRGSVRDVCFSPDGKRVISGSLDRTIRIWDAESGKEIMTLVGHSEDVAGVAVSPDGTRIASASYDTTVTIWDAESGEACLTLKGHEMKVNSVAFSTDGKRLVSGSNDGSIRIWDARNRQEAVTTQEATRLQKSAWNALQFASDDDMAIRRALQTSKLVYKQFPYELYRTTLGMAQYRSGLFDDAILTLTPSQSLTRQPPNQLSFYSCAFLAMSHWQIGNHVDAISFRKQLHELTQLEGFQGSDYDPLLQEVDELFESANGEHSLTGRCDAGSLRQPESLT